MQAPLTTLKCIIFIHFTLTAFASLGPWPNSYAIVQVFYLALGLWGLLQSENPLPVEMMLTTNILSIILDIIVLSVFYPIRNLVPGTSHPGLYNFSDGMCILNLLIKPLSAFLIYRILQERGGEYGGFSLPGGLPASLASAASSLAGSGRGGGSGGGGGGGAGGTYQNIDPEQPLIQS